MVKYPLEIHNHRHLQWMICNLEKMFRDRSSKMKEVEPGEFTSLSIVAEFLFAQLLSLLQLVLLLLFYWSTHTHTHTDINLVINQRRQTTKIRTSEFSPRVREATNVDVFTLSTEFTVQMWLDIEQFPLQVCWWNRC